MTPGIARRSVECSRSRGHTSLESDTVFIVDLFTVFIMNFVCTQAKTRNFWIVGQCESTGRTYESKERAIVTGSGASHAHPDANPRYEAVGASHYKKRARMTLSNFDAHRLI
jgi:hypothetical protein